MTSNKLRRLCKSIRYSTIEQLALLRYHNGRMNDKIGHYNKEKFNITRCYMRVATLGYIPSNSLAIEERKN